MAFWLDTASEELNRLDSNTSTDLLVLAFALRQFYDWLLLSARYVSEDEVSKVVYNHFRTIAHIAVKREDTAFMFVDALLGNLQSNSNFRLLRSLAAAMRNFGSFTDFFWLSMLETYRLYYRTCNTTSTARPRNHEGSLSACNIED